MWLKLLALISTVSVVRVSNKVCQFLDKLNFLKDPLKDPSNCEPIDLEDFESFRNSFKNLNPIENGNA
jgi:hypothetical protein